MEIRILFPFVERVQDFIEYPYLLLASSFLASIVIRDWNLEVLYFVAKNNG